MFLGLNRYTPYPVIVLILFKLIMIGNFQSLILSHLRSKWGGCETGGTYYLGYDPKNTDGTRKVIEIYDYRVNSS